MSVLSEVLRGALHFLIFLSFGCGFVTVALGFWISFRRADEYVERRGSIFSLRTPPPSEFSSEYYLSYRKSMWLGLIFLSLLAVGSLLLWLDSVIFGPAN